MHWETEDSAHDIQTAGYALLTQLLFNDMQKSTSIVNWLNTKQLKSGAYESTQVRDILMKKKTICFCYVLIRIRIK